MREKGFKREKRERRGCPASWRPPAAHNRERVREERERKKERKRVKVGERREQATARCHGSKSVARLVDRGWERRPSAAGKEEGLSRRSGEKVDLGGV